MIKGSANEAQARRLTVLMDSGSEPLARAESAIVVQITGRWSLKREGPVYGSQRSFPLEPSFALPFTISEMLPPAFADRPFLATGPVDGDGVVTPHEVAGDSVTSKLGGAVIAAFANGLSWLIEDLNGLECPFFVPPFASVDIAGGAWKAVVQSLRDQGVRSTTNAYDPTLIVFEKQGRILRVRMVNVPDAATAVRMLTGQSAGMPTKARKARRLVGAGLLLSGLAAAAAWKLLSLDVGIPPVERAPTPLPEEATAAPSRVEPGAQMDAVRATLAALQPAPSEAPPGEPLSPPDNGATTPSGTPNGGANPVARPPRGSHVATGADFLTALAGDPALGTPFRATIVAGRLQYPNGDDTFAVGVSPEQAEAVCAAHGGIAAADLLPWPDGIAYSAEYRRNETDDLVLLWPDGARTPPMTTRTAVRCAR